MRDKFIFIVVLLFLISCNNSPSLKDRTLNKEIIDKPNNSTSNNMQDDLPAEIVGSFSGHEDSYYLKNSDGNVMIINGSKVPVPACELLFVIKNNGSVQLFQETSNEKIVYNGILKIIENTTNRINVQCDVSTNDGKSNPTYLLTFDKSSNIISCSGKNEPNVILNRKKKSLDNYQAENANAGRNVNRESKSINGIYSFSDNSAILRISVNGSSWSGKTVIISGVGADYDNQNAQFQNGIVKGNSLYDESGYVEIGHVNGLYLTTIISNHSVNLRKQ